MMCPRRVTPPAEPGCSPSPSAYHLRRGVGQKVQGPSELSREVEKMDWGTGQGEGGGAPVIKYALMEHLLCARPGFCSMNTQ